MCKPTGILNFSAFSISGGGSVRISISTINVTLKKLSTNPQFYTFGTDVELLKRDTLFFERVARTNV